MDAAWPAWALPVAITEVAAPLLVGLLLGRRNPRLAAGLAGLLLVLDLALLRRPLFDVALVALLVPVGAWLRRAGRRRAGLVLLGVLAGTALAELAGRALLPPVELAPVWAEPWRAVDDRFPNVLGGTLGDEHAACALAYDDPPAPAGLSVLHLGDSVVHGSGVSPEQTFVARFAVSDPGRAHVVRAAPGVAPDVLLAAVRRAFGVGSYETVVLYVFAGNDLAELDFPYLCCPGGPLLDDGLQLRCDVPVAPSGLEALLAASPPPLSLRLLAARSRVAAHLQARWSGWRSRGDHWFADVQGGRRRALVRLASIVGRFGAEVTSRGGRPVVVVIPDREQAAAPERYADVLVASGTAGLPVVDAGPFVRAAADDDYVDPVHFSARGHARFATWLAPRLGFGSGAPRE